jgi:Fe2+ transport system protein B
LLKARLIREENTNRGLTYEVSHDTLIEPIEKSKQKRREEEEKIKSELERQKLALEAQKRSEELKENLKRLANEMQLREEAEAQKAEAEKQTIEAQKQKTEAETQKVLAETQKAEAEKQKRRARFYSVVSVLLLLVVVIAAFIISMQQSRYSADLKKRFEKKSDTLNQKNDTLRMVKESYNDIVINNISTQWPARNSTNDSTVINDTALSFFKDVIQDINTADTADARFKEVVNKVYYNQVKKSKFVDTIVLKDKTLKEKVEFLQKELPDIPMEKRKPYRFNKNLSPAIKNNFSNQLPIK